MSRDKIVGHFDKDTERVTIEADVDYDDLVRLRDWLNEIERWVRRRREKREGGSRWVLTRPIGARATARWMVGRSCWGDVAELDQHGTRKPWRCSACRVEKPAETPCWRQVPNTWAGHARERFCNACVERGGAPRPPKLRVLAGGSDAA